MTTRTHRQIRCQCGHAGELHHAENDQPFSSMWEEYTVDGFGGEGATFTNVPELVAAGDILKYLNPKCPNCGNSGTVSYA
jgi:hypothetical protein